MNENYKASNEDLKYFKDKFENIFLNDKFEEILNLKKIKEFILEISQSFRFCHLKWIHYLIVFSFFNITCFNYFMFESCSIFMSYFGNTCSFIVANFWSQCSYSIKELSNKCFILFLSALIPFTQYRANVFDESLIISIDCNMVNDQWFKNIQFEMPMRTRHSYTVVITDYFYTNHCYRLD